MNPKRPTNIAIGLIIIIIIMILSIGIVSWWRGHVQVQARLHLASAHVSDTADTVHKALEPNFKVSKQQIVTKKCEEKSPEISFTRLYDCNATAEMELKSTQTISTTQTEALIKTVLIGMGTASTRLEDLDRYIQDMDEMGTWQTSQPINIPNTAIAGVPPFNYYGGVGQEDIGVLLKAKIDKADAKKTILTVVAIQEYHACKSFFLPCAH